ncbi:MAG: hypothetical protein ACJAYJ_001693 [Saprospiraceae bacterium]|jgi:hypothetical protein
MRRNTGEKQYFTEIDGLCFLAIFPVLIQHLSERIIRYFSGYFATAIDQGQVDFTVRRGTVGLSACFFILLEKLFMINGIVRKIKIKWKQWTNVKGVNTNKGAFFPLLKIKYLLIPLACFSGHLNVLSGQTATNNFDHKNIELEMPALPSLDTMIASALQFSPLLKVQDKWIEIKAKQQQIKKKEWMDKISVGGSALFGSGTIYNTWTDGENPADLTSFNRNLSYNGGINIRFTAGDIVKGKEKRQLVQLELEKALLERQPMELQLREEVIRRYGDFAHCLTMIDLKVTNLEAMRLSLEVVEPFFRAGNLAATEYTTILSKKIKAEEELETMKARTVHCWRSLKEICGMR